MILLANDASVANMPTKRKILKRSHSRRLGEPSLRLTLGQTIHELRERKGLSLRALAKLVGVSAPFLCDVEKDRRKVRSLDALAKALDVSPEKLCVLDNRVTADLKAWIEKNPEVLAVLRQMYTQGYQDVPFLMKRRRGVR